jgi:hypothetical protein
MNLPKTVRNKKTPTLYTFLIKVKEIKKVMNKIAIKQKI